MLNPNLILQLAQRGRILTEDDVAKLRGDPKLGVLAQLPGSWSNTEGFENRAWNMIALPFGSPGSFGDFRLLLNQANETLDFDLVDLGVPNRGADHQDQHLSALRYLQAIDQFAATDAASDAQGNVQVPATPDTNDTPKGKFLPGPDVPPNTPVGIHREPGIFLHLANLLGPATNLAQPGPDIARLANIPHGDAVLALGFGGSAPATPGAPDFSTDELKTAFSPLPIGLGSTDLSNLYFGPYKHFHDQPFQNIFDPTNPLDLLNGAVTQAMPGATVKETTTFTVDSQVSSGGIQNIPFVVSQANATRVTATFWIQQVHAQDGKIRLVLQYAQRVLLEFFPRADGQPGLIQWPHISVNTLIRGLP
jgi:hypothetical protein